MKYNIVYTENGKHYLLLNASSQLIQLTHSKEDAVLLYNTFLKYLYVSDCRFAAIRAAQNPKHLKKYSLNPFNRNVLRGNLLFSMHEVSNEIFELAEFDLVQEAKKTYS